MSYKSPIDFPPLSDSTRRWRIIDTDVPFREVVRWYIKLTVPALLFILAACAICYFTVDIIMGTQAKAAFDKGKRDFEREFGPLPTPRR